MSPSYKNCTTTLLKLQEQSSCVSLAQGWQPHSRCLGKWEQQHQKNKTMKTAVTTITNCPINLIKRTQLYGDCNGLRSVVSQFSPPTNSLLESTVENRGDRKGRKIKCHKGQPRLPRPSRKDLETKLDSKEMVLL